MKSKYESIIAKRLSEFPDYEELTKQTKNMSSPNSNMGHLRDPDLAIAAPAGVISPISKIKDLIIEGSLDPKKGIGFYKFPKKMSYNVPEDLSSSPMIGGLGMLSRDILKSEIGSEILKRKLDPASQLANPKDLSVKTLESEDSRGMYKPSTGEISIMAGLSPENFAGTLAHEIGHKRYAQSTGAEFSKDGGSYSSRALQGVEVGGPKDQMILPENSMVKLDQLMNLIRGHHGSVLENPWEVETLKNIREKGILAEPITKELSPSQYKKYLKRLQNIKKYEDSQNKMKKLMAE